ncbi:LytR/AlgR family response regulator transcription factor [Rubrolithibacter danxiaensis]|uniref:LytR/AlgR family response regulator transcription factor n=1 Tax=Rubrolithibacter danxiaensis TaxID=3390805 RepID=UPI003BF7C830
MTRVILIDDEPLAREVVKEYLEEYPQIEVIAECNDGFEGVKAVNQLQPDLIFLDIQMPKINGFEMLELLDHQPNVIFTTAFDEYAIKAFETHAVDYLLKPFGRDRFRKGMDKWFEQKNLEEVKQKVHSMVETTVTQTSQAERIVVKTGNNIRIINAADVQYLEAYDDYVKIHTATEMFLKNKTMNYFEQVLNSSQFARIHRSFIVQLSQITRLDPYEKESYMAVLKSGKSLPVSKSGYARLKNVLGL